MLYQVARNDPHSIYNNEGKIFNLMNCRPSFRLLTPMYFVYERLLVSLSQTRIRIFFLSTTSTSRI